MNSKKSISPFVRVLSGVIGVLGFAAIAFRASQESVLQPDFWHFASFFAGFVFLFVSFFGKYPWDNEGVDDTDR